MKKGINVFEVDEGRSQLKRAPCFGYRTSMQACMATCYHHKYAWYLPDL